MITIKAVSSKKDLSNFIMLPFALYKNDPNWVPPLISDQKKFFSPAHNPFFEHSEARLFLAQRDGKTIGRITAHTNTQHNKEHQDNIGFFGFFECIDDQEAADALFRAAWDWNKAKGKTAIRGPLNFTINDEVGLLIDGFDTPPMLMMTHALPYYQALCENSGLAKAMDLYAFYSDRSTIPERLERMYELLLKRTGVTIHTLSRNKKQCRKDLETIFRIYTEAWQYNWGAVPLTEKEFQHLVDSLLPLADPDLILFAELDGRPVGFSMALPNYNEVLKVMNGRVNPLTIIKALLAKRKITTTRAITMGVIKEYQNRGIDTIFHYISYRNAIPKNLFHSEFSWVLETNTMMIRVAEMLGSRAYKTYRIYEKPIA
ncbi:MAG: GNAT family N-acetyltransferase [Candidatus Syntrophosphaera sp.]|nr:GNAT family N-acetyltransferase [Candidatus Syntrophosphaera sp.]